MPYLSKALPKFLVVGRISSLASQAVRRNPTTKRDSKNSVRRALKNAPHSPMCCIVDVHHTRGLVILFVQKYKENREMPKKIPFNFLNTDYR